MADESPTGHRNAHARGVAAILQIAPSTPDFFGAIRIAQSQHPLVLNTTIKVSRCSSEEEERSLTEMLLILLDPRAFPNSLFEECIPKSRRTAFPPRPPLEVSQYCFARSFLLESRLSTAHPRHPESRTGIRLLAEFPSIRLQTLGSRLHKSKTKPFRRRDTWSRSLARPSRYVL